MSSIPEKIAKGTKNEAEALAYSDREKLGAIPWLESFANKGNH